MDTVNKEWNIKVVFITFYKFSVTEEQRFYCDIIGFKGEFLFAETLRSARMMVVSNRGVMPVEGANSDSFFGATLKRIPLTRNGSRIKRKYCAFWKKDNSGPYIEEFAEILKLMY